MKAVDAGLYTALNADMGTASGSLGDLGASGPYRMIAPQTASLPYVIFNEQAGTNRWTMADLGHRSLVYQVKAVGDGHSGSVISDMDARLDTVLNDQPLTLTGWTCKRIRRESDVEYIEDTDGVLYHHIGGLFRIDVEPT
jgi:hypothetical protein